MVLSRKVPYQITGGGNQFQARIYDSRHLSIPGFIISVGLQIVDLKNHSPAAQLQSEQSLNRALNVNAQEGVSHDAAYTVLHRHTLKTDLLKQPRNG